MAKEVFNIVINIDDLDPNDRLYYDYVDWPIDSRASESEIDAALTVIYKQMAAPDKEFGTAFKSWFYYNLPKQYDTMCDILWDAIDTYVQNELTARFKEN